MVCNCSDKQVHYLAGGARVGEAGMLTHANTLITSLFIMWSVCREKYRVH